MTTFIALEVTAIVLAVLNTAVFWTKVAMRDGRFDKLLHRAAMVSSILCVVAAFFAAAFLLAAWADGRADMQVVGVVMSATMFVLLATLVSNVLAIAVFVVRESKAPSPAM